MRITPALAAQLSRKSYVDIFALRFGAGGGLPTVEPCRARQTGLGWDNPYPTSRNILYLHVPFCASRCRYCPYYQHRYTPELMSAYVEALTTEVAIVSDTPYARSTRFWCVYFGGGTPSLLRPEALERLTAVIHRSFRLTPDVEMTFEANPATLTEEKIGLLRSLGFGRVSLGVQSFHDTVLQQMGCAHSADRARRAIHSVLEQGLILNVDLLFGWAGQTQADLDFDLEQLFAGDVPHQVTLFPLRIAKGTPLADAFAQENVPGVMSRHHRVLGLDTLVEKRLREHAFVRAEIPISYSRTDAFPHRYQSVEGRVVGLGAGAGSVLEGAESLNERDVIRYISAMRENRCPAAHDGRTTHEQARERYVLFRILFMNRSLPGFRDLVARRFEEYYDERMGAYFEKVVQDLTRRGYVEFVGEKIVFTERFWNVLSGLEIGTPSIL